MNFTHLHLHTQYSLLDGAIKVPQLMAFAKEHKIEAVAITDHGNMYGVVDFYSQARKAGLKPIIGCEVYVAPQDLRDRSSPTCYHLVLLAENLEGYRNLVQLVSLAHLEGFYYHPRIDKTALRAHSGGLIGLSACLAGEVSRWIAGGQHERARRVAEEYREILGPDNFFLEIQHNGLAEQERVNAEIAALARETGIPLVATNDCHYPTRQDRDAHEILLCIQTGKTLADPKRMTYETDQFYLKSPEEMAAQFSDYPEAIETAIRIAERCQSYNILPEHPMLPTYEVPAGYTLESYLAERAQEGLKTRVQAAAARGETLDGERYEKRLADELRVIQQMGFAGYFLIVWDFINQARKLGVPVGPGRGSGAGSLVAYALRITDIDPIRYELLFERFLNPERVSMPDFDIDFCMNRRDEVLRYVAEKYGKDNVGQIITFGSLKARGTVRDVSRVLGLGYGDGDRVAKLVPEGPGVTLDSALEANPKLREACDADPTTRQVVDVARALSGLHRHAGMHAAGVVIADKPLWNYVPVCRGKNGELVTQYAKNEVEKAGLVKFDFLGLRTLTVIDTAVALIRQHENPDFDITAIPMDDPQVFELMTAGTTTGVFQLESGGFKDLMMRLKPDRFEDIIAAVALYRPGPLQGGMVDDFVRRKHGLTEVRYPHPLVEDILRETYGVIVYQEQVMQIANVMGGFSLGQADLLRRAMGKKLPEEMIRHRDGFARGCADRGIDAGTATEVFDLMEMFASYGFNKSHSAAYALISYQTAYLKAHHAVAFMAALLTSEKDNTDKLVKYIAEARAMGIEVLPPDVNLAGADFSISGQHIRFGLGAVKGIGETAVLSIIDARRDRPFETLFDFCERVDTRRVNRAALESLCKSGAFDSFGLPRHVLMASLDKATERALSAQRDRDSGQSSLFSLLEGPRGTPQSTSTAAPYTREQDLQSEQIWSEAERLAFEKASLGLYLTGHPLDRFKQEVRRYSSTTTAGLEDLSNGAQATLVGVVTGFEERTLKDNRGRMAKFMLEDREGQASVVIFSREYATAEEVLKADVPVVVRGTVFVEGDDENRSVRLRASEVLNLAEVRTSATSRVDVAVKASVFDAEAVRVLGRVLREHSGRCPLRFSLEVPGVGVATVEPDDHWTVTPDDALIEALERVQGISRVVLS